MANSNGWGDGAANNTIGWGQGANNTIGWGSVYAVSNAGLTNIIGTTPVLFTTEWTTTVSSESIELPYTGIGTYSGTIDWGDGNTSVNSLANRFHTYATAGTYTVIINGTCTGWDFNLVSGSTYITSVVNWGQLQLIEDIGYYFAYCPNLDLSSVSDTLDLTGITILDGLFYSCTSLTSVNNINSWDTSAITTMSEMFFGCTSFNQALSFDTSSVINMGSMFTNCSVFNQALSFNTSAVEFMNRMFRDATAFNQNISSWNTGAVTDMELMFRDAPAFDQNIGTWNVAKVTNFSGFMQGKTDATFSTTNLNAIYNGWSTQAVVPSLDITFGTAKYTPAATAGRLVLTGTKLWTITDGGL
jgi:surface protein